MTKTFRELFNNQFLTEAKLKKGLKIIYDINMNLVKPESLSNTGDQNPALAPAQNEPMQEPQQTTPEQNPVPEQPAQNMPVQNEPTQNEPEQQGVQPLPGGNENSITQPLPSVVTEADDELISANEEDKIIRKISGEIELENSQKDTIQSIDDIISILSETKKEGVEILDEFSADIVSLLCTNNAQELKQKVDKKSNIFVEILYGYKKEDSVGVRFVKRKNSDNLTSTMLVDNEIISAPFSIDRINKKIVETRNYEVKR